MAKRKPKKKAKKRQRINYPLLVGVLSLTLAVAWLFYPTYLVRVEQERQLEAVRKQLALLERENDELRERIEEMKSPEYIERYAREKLALVKPGEKAYVVLPPNKPKPKPKPKLEETESAKPEGVLARMEDFFTNLFGR